MEWLVNTIMQINTRLVSRPIPTAHSRALREIRQQTCKKAIISALSVFTVFSYFPRESFGENIQYFFFLAQWCKEAENQNVRKNNLKIGILGPCPSGELVMLFLCVSHFCVGPWDLLLRDRGHSPSGGLFNGTVI